MSDYRFRVDVERDAAVAPAVKNKAARCYLRLRYYTPHVPLESTTRHLNRFPADLSPLSLKHESENVSINGTA